MNATRSMTTRTKLLVIVASILLASLFVVGTIFALRQPTQTDFKMLNDNQIEAATKAREALESKLNDYLASFKTAYNASGSTSKAASAAAKDYDSFTAAVAKANEAADAIMANRVANDRVAGQALRQFVEDYRAEVAFVESLATGYAKYVTIFDNRHELCSDIFVGQTADLAERKRKLTDAAKDCYPALRTMQQTGNASYADFAKKVERRVKHMETDATTAQQAERDVADFSAEAATLEKKVDAAFARDASDEELNKLTAEIKAVNERIDESRANFDFAASRYVTTVKEMPTLYAAIYSTDIPERMKNFRELNTIRSDVLMKLAEARLVDR